MTIILILLIINMIFDYVLDVEDVKKIKKYQIFNIVCQFIVLIVSLVSQVDYFSEGSEFLNSHLVGFIEGEWSPVEKSNYFIISLYIFVQCCIAIFKGETRSFSKETMVILLPFIENEVILNGFILYFLYDYFFNIKTKSLRAVLDIVFIFCSMFFILNSESVGTEVFGYSALVTIGIMFSRFNSQRDLDHNFFLYIVVFFLFGKMHFSLIQLDSHIIIAICLLLSAIIYLRSNIIMSIDYTKYFYLFYIMSSILFINDSGETLWLVLVSYILINLIYQLSRDLNIAYSSLLKWVWRLNPFFSIMVVGQALYSKEFSILWLLLAQMFMALTQIDLRPRDRSIKNYIKSYDYFFIGLAFIVLMKFISVYFLVYNFSFYSIPIGLIPTVLMYYLIKNTDKLDKKIFSPYIKTVLYKIFFKPRVNETVSNDSTPQLAHKLIGRAHFWRLLSTRSFQASIDRYLFTQIILITIMGYYFLLIIKSRLW